MYNLVQLTTHQQILYTPHLANVVLF